MQTVTSKDGTTIAYDVSGAGPALILVGGMFEQRAMESDTSKLATFPLLTEHFTVYHYDRRGRGDSTDTLPYAVAREIEDIETLINEAGGSAFLSGISSGAALAFEATVVLGAKVRKLAMYDPPYNDDDEAQQTWRQFRNDLDQAIAEERYGDAVGLFMMVTGMPAEHLDGMRELPFWTMLEAIAPTIAYDVTAIGENATVPVEKAKGVTTPTLLLNGELSYPFMLMSGATLANALPNVEYRILAGQTHEVEPEAIAPVLVEFFTR
jgi:pimeloyl-ACP methyl ester carboxylesterase